MKPGSAFAAGAVLGSLWATALSTALWWGSSARPAEPEHGARASEILEAVADELDRANAAALAYAIARAERAEAALVKMRAPIVPGSVVPMEITAYGLGCDAPGPVTASGVEPVAGHTIAADPAVLPIGSIVRIAGKGQRQVQDVGSAVKGRTLDLYFDDCDEARRFGRQVRAVEVLHVAGRR